jgi:hypothetical protein
MFSSLCNNRHVEMKIFAKQPPLFSNKYFFIIIIINVGIRASLHGPQLISWALKLTSSNHEVCETRTGDI